MFIQISPDIEIMMQVIIENLGNEEFDLRIQHQKHVFPLLLAVQSKNDVRVCLTSCHAL